tara:strand:- start:30067 stop:30192 length:126 start_codon:yes stop_codon:yes gene_type:complete
MFKYIADHDGQNRAAVKGHKVAINTILIVENWFMDACLFIF